jgi:hypothetical protein
MYVCVSVSVAVALTKTKPKGKDHKQNLIQEIRDAIDKYTHLVVLRYQNMRAASFKDVRIKFRDSRCVSSLRSASPGDSNAKAVHGQEQGDAASAWANA